MGPIQCSVREDVDVLALQALFARAWGSEKPGYEGVLERSFTWVTAVDAGQLVGFVNVAWDGGAHLFLLDTTVDPGWQRQGVGTQLVAEAVRACGGSDRWLHVDAEDALMRSLYEPGGFRPTAAGLVWLGGTVRP